MRPSFEDIKALLSEIANTAFNCSASEASQLSRLKSQALLGQMLPAQASPASSVTTIMHCVYSNVAPNCFPVRPLCIPHNQPPHLQRHLVTFVMHVSVWSSRLLADLTFYAISLVSWQHHVTFVPHMLASASFDFENTLRGRHVYMRFLSVLYLVALLHQ